MRYVIVSVVKGEAGEFNNSLRKDVFEKFKAKSSKLPAHFTIKAPFEYVGDVKSIEKTIEQYCKKYKKASYNIKGYNHFEDRVIFMDVVMSKEGKLLHDGLIDELEKVSCIDFDKKDGKNKKFHVTISSKGIKNIFTHLWLYVNQYPCDYEEQFDNVCIYKWINNTWVLHKEYLFQ